eukprot:3864855-Alexandrium_andersonii.AAC.1
MVGVPPPGAAGPGPLAHPAAPLPAPGPAAGPAEDPVAWGYAVLVHAVTSLQRRGGGTAHR